jgi:type IV secretion system protein TrbI
VKPPLGEAPNPEARPDPVPRPGVTEHDDVGSQLAVGTGSTGDSDLVKALQQSVASTTNRAGQRLVERNLNVQPTITVRPGWPLRVIVHKDLVLGPYQAS